MKPLHPIEYEIFHALVRLKESGEPKSSFSNIFREVNRKRVADRTKPLSRPSMAYHIVRLANRKFVDKNNTTPHYPSYSLIEGVYKLSSWPPLCIQIASDHVFVVVCEEIKKCGLKPFSKACLETLKSQ